MIINVLLAPPILPRSRVGTFIFNTNINNNLEYSYKLHNNHGQMSGYRQYVHIVGVSFTTIMRHPVDRSISMVRACVRAWTAEIDGALCADVDSPSRPEVQFVGCRLSTASRAKSQQCICICLHDAVARWDGSVDRKAMQEATEERTEGNELVRWLWHCVIVVI